MYLIQEGYSHVSYSGRVNISHTGRTNVFLLKREILRKRKYNLLCIFNLMGILK